MQANDNVQGDNEVIGATKDATRRLARFVAEQNQQTLPKRLYPLAKLYTLDTLGAAIFGSTTPWAKAVAVYVNRFEGKSGSCSVIGQASTVSPAMAALANGTMGHSFETDDVHDESLLHPGTVVVPAALAVAEETNASGIAYLTAVILGYELMVRIGLGVGSLAHMMSGFHSTGTNGVFGSAAATAKLIPTEDRENTVLHALGIAGSLASGIMEFSQTGGMIKRLHAGRAAEGGVMAGYLAADGFTGPTTVLEGQYGYCATFSDKPEPTRLLERLGADYGIEQITVKPYSCCSDLHAIIDSVYAIRRQTPFELGSVRKIRVATYEKVIEQNALDPTGSVMAAQYSALFAAGAAVVSDMSDPVTYLNAPRASPELKALFDKVTLDLDEQLNADYPRTLGAEVSIELSDGRILSARTVGAKGSPLKPMSPSEIEAKFRRMVAPVYDGSTIEAIIAAVDRLDRAQSVASLGTLLRTAPLSAAGASG